MGSALAQLKVQMNPPQRIIYAQWRSFTINFQRLGKTSCISLGKAMREFTSLGSPYEYLKITTGPLRCYRSISKALSSGMLALIRWNVTSQGHPERASINSNSFINTGSTLNTNTAKFCRHAHSAFNRPSASKHAAVWMSSSNRPTRRLITSMLPAGSKQYRTNNTTFGKITRDQLRDWEALVVVILLEP